MTVYLDVLIVINLIVNYFLLLLTFKLSGTSNKNWYVILGAGIGSLFSLYIFIPVDSVILDCVIKIISSMLMILASVGFINLKAYLRNITILFCVSFLYSGCMMALWSIFKWDVIVINNSSVYLDISPLYLIVFSVFFYLIIVIAKSFLKRNFINAQKCDVKLVFNEKSVNLIGIFDTGNSVKDIFSNSEVIFISEKTADIFLGKKPTEFESNYRLLPCSTVIGSKLLEGVRIDKADIYFEDNQITLYKPILVISETLIDEEYSVILNPEILTKSEEGYVTVKNSRKSLKNID